MTPSGPELSSLGFTAKRSGRRFFANVKPNAISLVADETTVYTFDRAGRLSTAVIGESTYRRGLANRVLCKWREGPEGHLQAQRRWLSPRETRELFQSVTSDLGEAVGALESGDLLAADPSDNPALIDSLSRELRRAAAFDFAASERESELVNRIYRPVSILPPDQYLALVLQATEGCQYNRCSFCSFYRDRPFRIKPLDEFRRHMDAVLALLGEGLSIRRSVFLADANAVCIPGEQLISVLDAINQRLPVRPPDPSGSGTGFYLEGIHSFVDAFSGRSTTGPDFAGMRARNVRRLYLGVESGSGELLRFLRKPQTPEDILDTVRSIKAGGLNLGVILMLGLGGTRFFERHVWESIALMNSLQWSAGDLVFLSQYVDFPGGEYPELASGEGIESLSAAQMSQQYAQIRDGIRRSNGSPKIAPYNAEEFTY
jgi:hypothetical protein